MAKREIEYQGISLPKPVINKIKEHMGKYPNEAYTSVTDFIRQSINEKIKVDAYNRGVGRVVDTLQILLTNVIWEKTEGLGEPRTKKEKEEDTILKIKKYEDMSFDELKAEMIKRGLLK